MRRAILFVILTFGVYAVAQRSTGAVSSGGATSGMGATTAATAGTMPNASPSNGPGAGAPASNNNTATPLPGSANNPAPTPPDVTGGTSTTGFTNTGGFITNGGFVGGYVPMLQTPQATLPPALGNVTNSPAGISNNPSALQYANLPAGNGRPGFDLGAAYGTTASNEADLRPLGDIAREFRSHHGQQNARVFTNADIQKMNQNNGQVAMGTSIGPQSNTAPSGQPQSPTTPAVGNPSPQQNNGALPGNEPK